MLSYLELKNFKSFSNIFLDLRGSYGNPKKFVFIYGENGSGKSNLMLSLFFLLKTFNTLDNHLKGKSLFSGLEEAVEEGKRQELIQYFFPTLSDLIEDNKMIGAKGNMQLRFGFRLNDVDGSYMIELSNSEIVAEELNYRINHRKGVIYSLSKKEPKLSPGIFTDTEYKNELLDSISKYWGKHTLMAILFNELETKNRSYFRSKLHKNLLIVIDWLSKVSVLCTRTKGQMAHASIPLTFLRQLEKGIVTDKIKKELRAYESILDNLFTQLYSDIKSVYYNYSLEGNKTSYELFFKKQIDERIIDIPVSLESTGTRKVLEIFPMLFAGVAGATVFIDEIDSGVHDLLMKNLIESMKDSVEGQFIVTTHNTLLMESSLPENTYIIRVDANGNKSIDCIAEYKQRTHKNNSIRSKYLRGDYEGIPYMGYLDFQEMVQEAIEYCYSAIDDGE